MTEEDRLANLILKATGVQTLHVTEEFTTAGRRAHAYCIRDVIHPRCVRTERVDSEWRCSRGDALMYLGIKIGVVPF